MQMAMSGVPETPKKLKKTKVDTGAAHKKACRAAYAVKNRMQNMMLVMEEPCRPANQPHPVTQPGSLAPNSSSSSNVFILFRT